jgi:hypothetical protein
MSGRTQNAELRTQKRVARWSALCALLNSCLVALPADLPSLRADRADIERVYYNHRLGDKPPFEQVLPPAALAELVRQDLRKEAALKNVYGVEITPSLLDGEVQRINTTTRAPDMLAEIKAALGNDPGRFADAFAKPLLVERLLRGKFDNDDALHAPERRLVEQTRNELLAAKQNGADYAKLLALLICGHSNAVSETTWQLGPRPDPEPGLKAMNELEIKQRFGEKAQLLSSPPAGDLPERELYLEDLPAELRNVLHIQLRRPGDVSAVIETPGSFLLYLTKERTDAVLGVAGLFLPKLSYESWLKAQDENIQ